MYLIKCRLGSRFLSTVRPNQRVSGLAEKGSQWNIVELVPASVR